jgi:hypothetical protein
MIITALKACIKLLKHSGPVGLHIAAISAVLIRTELAAHISL